MRRGGRDLVVCAAAALALVVFTAPVLAVSATDLVERGSQYDGRVVTYQGEVVGDIMRRGKSTVINVHDGTYAIGVWASSWAVSEVTRAGRYSVTGDRVEVRGVFHRACAEHGGDTDIHAETVTVLAPGRRIREPFHTVQAWVTVVLIACALALAGWYRSRSAHAQGGDEH
jgi:hypothetical protein